MTPREFEAHVVQSLEGMVCWFVCYGAVDSCFQLACGAKVRRATPLRNPALTTTYRRYEGSANLLIWCTWRIEKMRRIVASSRGNAREIARGLDALCDQRIVAVKAVRPFWDLELDFGSGHRLRIFTDFPVRKNATQDNWLLSLKSELLFAGPGARYGVEQRSSDQVRT